MYHFTDLFPPTVFHYNQLADNFGELVELSTELVELSTELVGIFRRVSGNLPPS